jgi:chromosome segregation and condensation protein ScpB
MKKGLISLMIFLAAVPLSYFSVSEMRSITAKENREKEIMSMVNRYNNICNFDQARVVELTEYAEKWYTVKEITSYKAKHLKTNNND